MTQPTEKQDDAMTILDERFDRILGRFYRDEITGADVKIETADLIRPFLPTADLAGTKAAHPPAATGQGADGMLREVLDVINYSGYTAKEKLARIRTILDASPSDAKQHDMVSIIAKLPKTADGVICTGGERLYDEEGREWFAAYSLCNDRLNGTPGGNWTAWLYEGGGVIADNCSSDIELLYSTREAALKVTTSQTDAGIGGGS